MQAAGKKLEADMADLKNRLKMQEMETRKANAKFVSSIAAQEKLKTEFDAERKAWAEEKAALVTRAEQAEKTLSEKTAELSGLKRQVSQMVATIFGKSSCRLSSSLECFYLIISSLSAAYLILLNRSQKCQPQPERGNQAEGRVYPGGAALHRVTACFGCCSFIR